MRDSNPLPQIKSLVLKPDQLIAHKMVDVEGIEPSTHGLKVRCSNLAELHVHKNYQTG